MNRSQFLALSDSDRLNFVLEGEAYYACVHTPNMSAVRKFNDRPRFQLYLLLDAENEAKARSMNMDVKPADDTFPKNYVQIRRKVKEGVDPNKVKPAVVDSQQNPIPETILIGNGSKVVVKFGMYWLETQKFPSTVLFKVMVKKLVPYTPSNKDKDLEELAEDGGFTVDTQVFSGAGLDTDGMEDALPWDEVVAEEATEAPQKVASKKERLFAD